jgi:hypothetical protein
MEDNDLRAAFAKLQLGYHRKNDNMIVESIDKLIKFLQHDKEHYPNDIRVAIEEAIKKFDEFQYRVLINVVVDYDDEWNSCKKLIDTVTYGVIIPWLNKDGQKDFGWISGGES